MKRRNDVGVFVLKELMIVLVGWLSVACLGATQNTPDAGKMQLFNRISEELRFQEWKGKTKEPYKGILPTFDLSGFQITTGKVELVVKPKKSAKKSELIVLTKEGGNNLFSATAVVSADPVEAQMVLLWKSSLNYRRPSDLVLLDGVGDRAYRGKFYDGHYIVFVRNNVYVTVNSWSDLYPAETLARQIDEMILKQCRQPSEKK